MHYSRNRNYDLSIKANTLATLINTGMNGRDAIKLSEIAPDAEQVWLNSREIIEAKQNKMFFETDSSSSSSATGEGNTSIKGDKSTLQDISMQGVNSPFVDNLSSAGGSHGRNA
jgi:hypothetical protein